MTETTSASLISTEAWKTAASKAFAARTSFFDFALKDDTLVGQPDDVINFPVFTPLVGLTEVDELDDLPIQEIKQTNSQARIKEAGTAVSIRDKALLSSLGDPQGFAIKEFGRLAAEKVDGDLYAAATASIAGGILYPDGSAATESKPLEYNAGAGVGVGYKVINTARAKFGEDNDSESFAGLFLHTTEVANLLNDDKYIEASQGNGINGVVHRRIAGQLAGLNVIGTDRVPVGKGVILKNDALGVFYKRRPIVERDRDIIARATVTTTNLHYAVKRVNDKGVLVVNFNTADA